MPSFQACRSSVWRNQYQFIRPIRSDLEPSALKEGLAPQVNSAQFMGVLSIESSIEFSPWFYRSATDSGSLQEIPGADRRDRGAHQGEESREEAQEPLRQRCDPIRAFVSLIRFRVDRQGCPKQHLNLTTPTFAHLTTSTLHTRNTFLTKIMPIIQNSTSGNLILFRSM